MSRLQPTTPSRPYCRSIAEAQPAEGCDLPRCLLCGTFHEVMAIAVWPVKGKGPTIYSIYVPCGGDVKAKGDEAFHTRREYVAERAANRRGFGPGKK